MPVPFSEGQGQMSESDTSVISVHVPPVMQTACLLLVARSLHWEGELGSHMVLRVLANRILQGPLSLWFSRTARALGHVWLDRPFGCEDVHLKALVVTSLGPTGPLLQLVKFLV